MCFLKDWADEDITNINLSLRTHFSSAYSQKLTKLDLSAFRKFGDIMQSLNDYFFQK